MRTGARVTRDGAWHGMTQGMAGRVAAPLTDSLRKATRRIDTENKIQALSDVTEQK